MAKLNYPNCRIALHRIGREVAVHGLAKGDGPTKSVFEDRSTEQAAPSELHRVQEMAKQSHSI